jgi:predicted lysophospholipase L1 biosynthesis ABC-type transport system permease subunit
LASISDWLASKDRAGWLSEQLDQAKVRGELTGERLLALARSVRMEGKWTAATADTQPRPRQGLFDLPRRTRWMIVLSFLVCAAGVTNAMFMSVTERFAEIATMKCLGALDEFLMLMFLMESALQGAVGGALGILLGMGLAVGRGTISFGMLAFDAMPWTDLMWCAALSLLAGMMLAVLSAVGPAWMAARLAPMEAMRID